MKELRFAVKNTVPIFFTYLFIGIAFGILMSDAGYSVLLTTASSLFIYAGSMQLVMVPMMTSTVRIGEELSASALTRGLGGPTRRTNICRIGFRGQDAVLLAGCVFVVGVWILELCGVRLW